MAHRLVNHRKALGLTQKEFAGQIGVDPSTLARWERGDREPTGRFINRVTRALRQNEQACEIPASWEAYSR